MGRPDLKSLVTQVVEDHKKYQAALEKEQAEKAALVRWVIDEVRPALPALVSRVFPVGRGLDVGPVDGILGDRGVLMEDGTLAVLCKSPPRLTQVSILTVVTSWDIPRFIEAVVDALERQAHGNKEKATQAIEEEAARLRAIAALVRGGK